MDRSIGVRGQLGFAHTASTYTACDFQHHGRARGVAVRSFVIRSQLVQQREHQGQSNQNQRDARQHVQHDGGSAFGVEEYHVTNDQQHWQEYHGAERNPLQDGKNREQRAVELGVHLAAVVARYHDHLAPTRSARFGRVAGLVLRHDVLADTSGESAGQHGSVEHLGGEQESRQQRDHDGHYTRRWQKQCKNSDYQRSRAADNARGFGSGSSAEIFYDCGKTRILLHLLGNVQRRLLLFFSPRRTRSDFL